MPTCQPHVGPTTRSHHTSRRRYMIADSKRNPVIYAPSTRTACPTFTNGPENPPGPFCQRLRRYANRALLVPQDRHGVVACVGLYGNSPSGVSRTSPGHEAVS